MEAAAVGVLRDSSVEEVVKTHVHFTCSSGPRKVNINDWKPPLAPSRARASDAAGLVSAMATRFTSAASMRAVIFAILALASVSVRADLAVTAELVAPELDVSPRAVDAHDDVAFVVGDGVVAVTAKDATAPRVLSSLTDHRLLGCAGVTAYRSPEGKRRLAVACAGSDSAVLIDAEDPARGLAILGSVSDPTALSGASSIVVRDALAFVAASGVARVVSLDVSSETNPRILSFVKLSAAQDVSLAPDNHVVVGAGAKHGGGRVTILSYVPSGVLMKVGSIKDGRLEGAVSVLRPQPVDPNIILAVSAAEGGSFLVVNGTTRARPTIVAALQAAGRAAASVPLNDDGSDSVAWNPNGHKSLGGARALAVAENGIAYVLGSAASAVSAIDATDANEPRMARKMSDPRLGGLSDLCATGPRGASSNGGVAAAAAKGGPATVVAVAREESRVVVLRDAGETAAATVKNEL